MKNIFNCCKWQIGYNFHFKDRIPKDLTSGVIYNYQCGFCNDSYYSDSGKQLNEDW